MLKCIAAIAKNGVIGNGRVIPWRSSADMKWFRAVTLGHNLLMGRKTYQSLGRPLDGRVTYVVTSNPQVLDQEESEFLRFIHPTNLPNFLREWWRKSQDTMFVCGGAQLYQEAFAYCDDLLITHVDAEPVVENAVLFPIQPLWEECREFACTHSHWETNGTGGDAWARHARQQYEKAHEPRITIVHYVKTSCGNKRALAVQGYLPFDAVNTAQPNAA